MQGRLSVVQPCVDLHPGGLGQDLEEEAPPRVQHRHSLVAGHDGVVEGGEAVLVPEVGVNLWARQEEMDRSQAVASNRCVEESPSSFVGQV